MLGCTVAVTVPRLPPPLHLLDGQLDVLLAVVARHLDISPSRFELDDRALYRTRHCEVDAWGVVLGAGGGEMGGRALTASPPAPPCNSPLPPLSSASLPALPSSSPLHLSPAAHLSSHTHRSTRFPPSGR